MWNDRVYRGPAAERIPVPDIAGCSESLTGFNKEGLAGTRRGSTGDASVRSDRAVTDGMNRASPASSSLVCRNHSAEGAGVIAGAGADIMLGCIASLVPVAIADLTFDWDSDCDWGLG